MMEGFDVTPREKKSYTVYKPAHLGQVQVEAFEPWEAAGVAARNTWEEEGRAASFLQAGFWTVLDAGAEALVFYVDALTAINADQVVITFRVRAVQVAVVPAPGAAKAERRPT